jgi:O-antigen ligase
VLPDLIKYSILSLSMNITPGTDPPGGDANTLPSATVIDVASSASDAANVVVLSALILLKKVLFNISLNMRNPVALVALSTAKYITSILSAGNTVKPPMVILLFVKRKLYPCVNDSPFNHTNT